MGNDVDMLEMAKICWKMTEIFYKRLKYVENDLQIWEMDKIFVQRLKYMDHGICI